MLAQLPNEIIVAAAGGGKTTRIVELALGSGTARSALVTYTQNNVHEIERRLVASNGYVPPSVEVWSWFSFLLRELARPYQNFLHGKRIDGIHWVEGRSARYAKRTDTSRFYFADGRHIFSDKLAQFVCECDRASGGAVMRRIARRFKRFFVDEVQDMSGYDLDVLELMLKAEVHVTLVGDHRQATYRTNNSARNSAFSGVSIVGKFREWERGGLAALRYEQATHRSNQSIADFADALFPDDPPTKSQNVVTTGHDGVFTIPAGSVHAYVKRYNPQVLRLDRKTPCMGLEAMNFGESKGLTFDRVLIFPHKSGQKWLMSGDFSHVAGSVAKMYVGITRARHSVTFVHEGAVQLKGVTKSHG